jgi:hypothetical protein
VDASELRKRLTTISCTRAFTLLPDSIADRTDSETGSAPGVLQLSGEDGAGSDIGLSFSLSFVSQNATNRRTSHSSLPLHHSPGKSGFGNRCSSDDQHRKIATSTIPMNVLGPVA